MQYIRAKKIADRIIDILQPYCDVINIAGSVRRHKENCKDIEICCIPKTEFIQTELFGSGETKRKQLFKQSVETISEKVIKGNTDGRYMQIVLKKCHGFKLDLFMPMKEDYYRQLAIRTGSREYSQEKIAKQWLRLGWCGTAEGLRRISDCLEKKTNDGKSIWIIINKNGERPPIWSSEKEFFRWLGVQYLDPPFRELKDHSFTRELYK